jgi:hypothetical protein
LNRFDSNAGRHGPAHLKVSRRVHDLRVWTAGYGHVMEARQRIDSPDAPRLLTGWFAMRDTGGMKAHAAWPRSARWLSLLGLVSSFVYAGYAAVTPAAAAAVQATLYAAPAGSGTSCSPSAPCTLAGARSLVESMRGSMTGYSAVAGISVGWGWGFASPYCPGCAHGGDYAGDNQVLDNYVHSDGLGDGNGNTVEAECIYTLGGQGDGNGPANYSFTSQYTANTDLGVGTFENSNNNNFTQASVAPSRQWPPAAQAIITSAGPPSPVEPLTGTLDDDCLCISYTGTSWSWSGDRGRGDDDNGVHQATGNGDSFSVTFTGTGISWISEKSSSQGTAEVYLDGTDKGPYNASSSSTQAQQVIYSVSGLPDTTHTLKALDVYRAAASQGQQLDQWPCKNQPGTNQDFNP